MEVYVFSMTFHLSVNDSLVSDATKHPKFNYSPFPEWELDGKGLAILVGGGEGTSAEGRMMIWEDQWTEH